ncbi:MAG: acyl-CoA dehydrogenase family protein [Actinobacteria bacterium]|nr:acyl-CoA dehydrogenase family protein [Actinomycetota bacterium]MBU1942668.1 acyl-CoA dehydrogenase family protein [Actinomycetota bacterium]MBU2685990.1 acyl-CoA dehydrogenase family protein [Actinomycetota bacterium]
MDFELTDEQRAAVDMAHDFALNELRPIAEEWDKKGEFPADLILPKAAQAGLPTAGIPEEFGGGGLDPLTSAMVFEELAWGCAGLATSIGANNLATAPIQIAGTQEQKEKWLPRLCDEKNPKLAGFCLTEPGAGSDVSAISTTAKEDGDAFILNGQKCFITNGGISDMYTVFAQTDQGLCGFIVDGNAEGVSMGRHEDKLGIRASHTAEVFFENVKVPKEDMLGAPGSAFVTVMLTLDQTRAGVAALAVGVARAAFEEANAYAKERVQFGKPIMVNQAISFMLTEMLMNIEAGRRLYYYAGWLANKMAETGKTSRRLSVASSIAKAFCGDVAMKVTTDAVQVLGGYGYMKDYPVEKYMRDAKIMQIYEGTAQIQRYVIAANLMGIKEVKQ